MAPCSSNRPIGIVSDLVASAGLAAPPAQAQQVLFVANEEYLRPSYFGTCDSSSVPPVLNVNDFSCFLSRFAAGDSYANCDGSTGAPVLSVNDFSCFLNSFAAGCS